MRPALLLTIGLALSASVAATASAADNTVDLAPAADTFVEAGTQTTWDHGLAEHLTVDHSPADVTYLKFDLSAAAAPVTRATPTLPRTYGPPDGEPAPPAAPRARRARDDHHDHDAVEPTPDRHHHHDRAAGHAAAAERRPRAVPRPAHDPAGRLRAAQGRRREPHLLQETRARAPHGGGPHPHLHAG